MNNLIYVTLISAIGSIILSIALRTRKAHLAEARVSEKNYLFDKEEI